MSPSEDSKNSVTFILPEELLHFYIFLLSSHEGSSAFAHISGVPPHGFVLQASVRDSLSLCLFFLMLCYFSFSAAKLHTLYETSKQIKQKVHKETLCVLCLIKKKLVTIPEHQISVWGNRRIPYLLAKKQKLNKNNNILFISIICKLNEYKNLKVDVLWPKGAKRPGDR